MCGETPKDIINALILSIKWYIDKLGNKFKHLNTVINPKILFVPVIHHNESKLLIIYTNHFDQACDIEMQSKSMST